MKTIQAAGITRSPKTMMHPVIIGVLFSFLIAPFLLLQCDPALAARGEGIKLMKQEMYETGAVLISRETTEPNRVSIHKLERNITGGTLTSMPYSTDAKLLSAIWENYINSFEDYVKWMQKNIGYQRDGDSDIWSSPEETLERKYGDCEDFAFLNAAVLRIFGYRAKVLVMAMLPEVKAVGSAKGDHAICVFEKNGRYYWLDNHELKETRISSFGEFAKFILISHGSRHLYEVTPDSADQNAARGGLRRRSKIDKVYTLPLYSGEQ
ncbi:transglutaminase-like domain-containing protein [Candidatus Omnitrophota bacterium]